MDLKGEIDMKGAESLLRSKNLDNERKSSVNSSDIFAAHAQGHSNFHLLLASLNERNRDEANQNIAASFAETLASNGALRGKLNTHEFASCLGVLAKWDDEVFQRAAVSLAARLETDSGLCNALSGAQIADCLIAFGKWHKDDACRRAGLQLAIRLADDEPLR